jgi:deoxyribose-phosphate aldolase
MSAEPRSLSEMTAADLERLIETITSMVSDRLGLPPDGVSAPLMSPPAIYGAPGSMPSPSRGLAYQEVSPPQLPRDHAAPTAPSPAAPTASCSSCACSRPAGPPSAMPSHYSPAPSYAPAPSGGGSKSEPKSDRVSLPAGIAPTHCRDVAGMIDHTLLKPNAREDEVWKLCQEARQYGFASVCVNGSYVELAAAALRGSAVKVCVVVGFPLGAMTPEAKAFEARDAIRRGADEIDMVINVGQLKSRHYDEVLRDIQAVREATRGKTLKVILETSMLDDEEKRAACVLSKAADADFVKTSTGFGGGGATAEDIALMRAAVGPKMGIKASGGVRSCEDAMLMISNGATRLGASAGVAIIGGDGGAKKSSGY